jgi:hypothetical protein
MLVNDLSSGMGGSNVARRSETSSHDVGSHKTSFCLNPFVILAMVVSFENIEAFLHLAELFPMSPSSTADKPSPKDKGLNQQPIAAKNSSADRARPGSAADANVSPSAEKPSKLSAAEQRMRDLSSTGGEFHHTQCCFWQSNVNKRRKPGHRRQNVSSKNQSG